MPNENEKTDAKEFDKIVQLLRSEPYMIPLQRHSKDPDVPKGESWKDPKYRLTTVQARER